MHLTYVTLTPASTQVTRAQKKTVRPAAQGLQPSCAMAKK